MFEEIPSPDNKLWSLNAAVNWIEHRLQATSNDQTFLLGVEVLYDALLESKIQSHGSINGNPLGPIPAHVWARVLPVAEWLYTPSEMKKYGTTQYSVKLLPFKRPPILSDAEELRFLESALDLTQLSQPHEIPWLPKEQSERLALTDVFFYSADVVRLWPSDRPTKLRRPRIGRTHKKIAKSLAIMPVRGGRRGDILHSPKPYSCARIAQMLINMWIDRGDNEIPEKRTLERAVVNYYKRVKVAPG